MNCDRIIATLRDRGVSDEEINAMLLATGRADVWLEAQAKPWDLAPLKIIAEEAGCVTFDFEGNDTIYGGNYVICVPALADEVKRFTVTRVS